VGCATQDAQALLFKVMCRATGGHPDGLAKFNRSVQMFSHFVLHRACYGQILKGRHDGFTSFQWQFCVNRTVYQFAAFFDGTPCKT
jgi:hypothetical protein